MAIMRAFNIPSQTTFSIEGKQYVIRQPQKEEEEEEKMPARTFTELVAIKKANGQLSFYSMPVNAESEESDEQQRSASVFTLRKWKRRAW